MSRMWNSVLCNMKLFYYILIFFSGGGFISLRDSSLMPDSRILAPGSFESFDACSGGSCLRFTVSCPSVLFGPAVPFWFWWGTFWVWCIWGTGRGNFLNKSPKSISTRCLWNRELGSSLAGVSLLFSVLFFSATRIRKNYIKSFIYGIIDFILYI